jgi:hypothetical protein
LRFVIIVVYFWGMRKAWDELTPEDLPTEDLRKISKRHGFEVAKDIWRLCRGTSFSLPMRLPKRFCIRYIRQHWDGHNASEVARELGITDRCVYNYINDGLPDAPSQTQSSPQVSLGI